MTDVNLKRNLWAGLSLTVLCAAILTLALLTGASGAQAASAGLSGLSDQAVAWLESDYRDNGIRNADSGVGSFTFYLLNKAGIDTGSWFHNGVSLKEAVLAEISKDVSHPDDVCAKVLAQDLLAAQAAGRSDLAGQVLAVLQKRQKESGFDDNDYSNFAACDLLNRAGCLGSFNSEWAKSYFMSRIKRGDDGAFYGWGSYSWQGSRQPDVKATCEAVRALAGLDPANSDSEIKAVVRESLDLLQKRQQSDGSFLAGMDDPAIDTVEVIKTLNLLGMKPDAWLRGGKSAVDYLLTGAVNADGSLGSSGNSMDANWVLDVCTLLKSAPATQTGQISVSQTNPTSSGETNSTSKNSQENSTAQPSAVVTFSDIGGHWAEKDILLMAAKGYASGVGNHLFAPDASVTRAQFAAFLVKALGITGQQGREPLFSDVPDNHWAASAINAAGAQGLISGVGDGRFLPDRSITREELAVMAVKALKMKGVDVSLTQEQVEQALKGYSDADRLAAWSREAVAACISRGIITGRAAGSIAGKSYTSRAETVIVLEKLLKSLGSL